MPISFNYHLLQLMGSRTHKPKFTWVIGGELLRGSRPGFDGRMVQVSKSEVKKWIKKAKRQYRVKSIICLLDENHLRFYEQLPHGLIRYYRKKHFEVLHIPVPRLASMRVSHLTRIWSAYSTLRKPVLIHCSAGVGRTGKAIAHIRRQLKLAQSR